MRTPKMLGGILLSLTLLLGIASCSRTRSARTNNPQGQPQQSPRADAVDLLRDSGVDVTNLSNIPEVAIPDAVLARANCLIVVPQMVKGGFVFGAKYGRGVATCKNNGQWSAPAFVTIAGGSWGAQIGAEVVDLVLAVMNQDGMDALLNSHFKIGGYGSVAAGPVGRQASAQQGGWAQAGVLTYSRTKGLYAGLTLEGAYVNSENDLNQAYYGRPLQAKTILSGEINAPQNAGLFLDPVRAAVGQAKAKQAQQQATE